MQSEFSSYLLLLRLWEFPFLDTGAVARPASTCLLPFLRGGAGNYAISNSMLQRKFAYFQGSVVIMQHCKDTNRYAPHPSFPKDTRKTLGRIADRHKTYLPLSPWYAALTMRSNV